MLSYDLFKESDLIRVQLTGKLTEASEQTLKNLMAEVGGSRLILHCRGISEINFFGAKLWILAMTEFNKTISLQFEECSEILMRYRALIPDMTGNGQINSIVISYKCSHCGDATESVIKSDAFSTEKELAPVPCKTCGNSAHSTLDPEELFSFLDD